jgi:hypothetical protein
MKRKNSTELDLKPIEMIGFWYNLKQVKHILGVSQTRVTQLASRLGAVRISGNATLYRADLVDDYLKHNTRRGGRPRKVVVK